MIKVGIIGCGKMADQHAFQIRRIPGARIVGVCDAEPLMAKQMADRFSVNKPFTDPQEMLDSVKPDVVHITTPPQSHFSLGKMCLEAGINVYMEKPFTVDTTEAEALIALAGQKGLKVTVGHNAQFTHAMIRMRELVKSGYLGGKPVHMESQYCYAFTDPSYAKVLLGDQDHWVRRLPGSLLQNIISHGISKIAEFLTGERPEVITLPQLERLLDPAGPTGGKLEWLGRPVRRLAMIHCVGSRQIDGVHEPQADGQVNDYCSRVCCTATLHAANEIRTKFPGTEVFDLYQDIRTYGRGHEDAYRNASENHVLFLRYIGEEPPEVIAAEGETYLLMVKVKDRLTQGEEIEVPVDLVVLAVGMMPSPVGDLTEMLKITPGKDRFLLEAHPQTTPGGNRRPRRGAGGYGPGADEYSGEFRHRIGCGRQGERLVGKRGR